MATTNENAKPTTQVPTSTQAVVLYVHDADYFFAEDISDRIYLGQLEQERLDRVAQWRAENALRQARKVRFNILGTALARAGYSRRDAR